MSQTSPEHGHRDRLRQRFLSDPRSLPDTELLELILTYAIPRRDIWPLANELIQEFGDISGIFAASYDELLRIDGIGEQAAIMIKAIAQLANMGSNETRTSPVSKPREQEARQPKLFDVEPELGPLFNIPQEPQLRTYANDEIENALQFIPEAARFESAESFRAFLMERLPYNSISTRQRRANYILNRYFADGRIDTPLAYFAVNCSQDDLKTALFYETLKMEPLLVKVAEELVWPAMSVGHIDREELRELTLRYLPDIGASSQKNILRSIYYAYGHLDIGLVDDNILRFQIHKGMLESFLYILAAEYPQPGVYSFEALYNGPMRRWLLWDKEWIRQQLYNLQDFGIITKVSEIDTVRQFTLQFKQMEALRHYFEHPERGKLAIRDREA